jgi:gliding motility-associated-like protein
VATLQQTTTYQVTVSDANGCTQTDTLELRIRDSIAVYIPNVFTPNGDALNEVFTVFARPGAQVIVDVFRVFNRWGELVYEGKNMTPGDYAQGWDGQVRGKDAPADVYVWYAELRLPDGTVEHRQGDVTLLR